MIFIRNNCFSKRLIITVIPVLFGLFECLHTCCSVMSVYIRIQAQYNNLFMNNTIAFGFKSTFLGFFDEFHKHSPFNTVQGLTNLQNDDKYLIPLQKS